MKTETDINNSMEQSNPNKKVIKQFSFIRKIQKKEKQTKIEEEKETPKSDKNQISCIISSLNKILL